MSPCRFNPPLQVPLFFLPITSSFFSSSPPPLSFLSSCWGNLCFLSYLLLKSYIFPSSPPPLPRYKFFSPFSRGQSFFTRLLPRPLVGVGPVQAAMKQAPFFVDVFLSYPRNRPFTLPLLKVLLAPHFLFLITPNTVSIPFFFSSSRSPPLSGTFPTLDQFMVLSPASSLSPPPFFWTMSFYFLSFLLPLWALSVFFLRPYF